jgi:hypothetical protein
MYRGEGQYETVISAMNAIYDARPGLIMRTLAYMDHWNEEDRHECDC